MVLAKKRHPISFSFQGPEHKFVLGGGIIESLDCVLQVKTSVPNKVPLIVKGSWWPSVFGEIEICHGQSLLLTKKRYPEKGTKEEVIDSSRASLLTEECDMRLAIMDAIEYHRGILELRMDREDGQIPKNGYLYTRLVRRAATIGILKNLLSEPIFQVSHIFLAPREFTMLRIAHAMISFSRDGYNVGVFPCGHDVWGHIENNRHIYVGNERAGSSYIHDVTIKILL